ncbi:glycoside hydrolase family 3 C-terminal domain-containing protein [Caulobacter segnis]
MLLKNESKNGGAVLPLDGKKIKRLALLGTHAKDTPIGGYSDVPRHVVSIHEGLTAEAKAHAGFALDYAEAVRDHRAAHLGSGRRGQVRRPGHQRQADRRGRRSRQEGRCRGHGAGRQ